MNVNNWVDYNKLHQFFVICFFIKTFQKNVKRDLTFDFSVTFEGLGFIFVCMYWLLLIT